MKLNLPQCGNDGYFGGGETEVRSLAVGRQASYAVTKLGGI